MQFMGLNNTHDRATWHQNAWKSKSTQAHPCSMFTSQTIQTNARQLWFDFPPETSNISERETEKSAQSNPVVYGH